jgi:Tol biopolymer transport system component
LEEFVKFHIFLFLAILFFAANLSTISAQADSVIGQITSSAQESFAGGISGNGRLIVFESNGNIATENPRNTDGNREIFIFDYAQRRIFQITDTRSLLTDPTKAITNDNIRVAIINVRPVISNDGRWIAFGSNATTSTPTAPDATNPGNFNAQSFDPTAPATTPANPLLSDGNTEMWFYQIPALAPVANLSAGNEIALTDLSAGTFTRVTNTLPSRLPSAGTATAGPVVADDNREASINDDGNYIAFVSNRNLAPNTGSGANADFNDEIFTYARNSNTASQVTRTTRGTITAPIYNQSPTISGNGLRILFLSNADNPVIGMTGGSNTDGNVEIFYTDVNAIGTPVATAPSPTVIGRQITTTTRNNPGDLVNVLDAGRRMSRDGRYIAFDSYADLAGTGAIQTSFALYLFDTTLLTAPYRQIGPRSDADTAASGGDVSRFPGFTDYNNGVAQTLVFESRLNITAAGAVPATAADGLNPDAARPVQIYSYPLTPSPTDLFTRLTKFPAPSGFLGLTQPIPSDTLSRMTFNLAFTEVGTGNTDLTTEAFYFLLPAATSQQTATFNFATGASRIPVSASPTPTPATSPSPTPTPSATPTPQTPATVLGVSPGMLTYVNLASDYFTDRVFFPGTAVGSLQRSFTLPIELSGTTVTINGAAAGIKSVRGNEVEFVVPPGLLVPATGTSYPIVININGAVFRSTITVVPARPDIFTTSAVPGPGGRARVFNATNRVLTGEPITVTTVRIRGGRRVPTVLRVFLTGVGGVPNTAISIRVGTREITGTAISAPVLREPGVYSIDFTLPIELRGAGDVPIIVTVTAGTTVFQSRLEDTAPRFKVL